MHVSSQRTRRSERSNADDTLDRLADLVDHVARGLRVGLALPTALDAALDAQPSALPALRRARLAQCSVADALAHAGAHHLGPTGMSGSPGSPGSPGWTGWTGSPRSTAPIAHGDERIVLHALLACHLVGGHAVGVLDRAGSVLRERRAWRLERRAQSAQARLSAIVLTALPPAVAVWGLLTSHQVRRAYTEVPFTVVATSAGLLCNAIGWWWMRRLVGAGGGR